MKRLLSILVAIPLACFAQTKTPIQLLNPAGSAAGQAIVSTGPNTSPTWGGISLSGGVSGTLPIANGGTNATTASAALSNLGGYPTTGGTLTGDVTMSNTVGGRTLRISTPTGQFGTVRFQKGGLDRFWVANDGTTEGGANAGSNFQIRAIADDGSTLIATPITITRSTGVTTFSARPVFGSATPWDNANLASPASTTGNLSQFAATTSAQLSGVVSDETGSGSLVFATSPTLSGTVAGAHSYSGAITFTSTITPSQTAGIVGTTTNNNANAGSVGEYQTATGSPVTMTSGAATNLASLPLTAGDWEVQGVVSFGIASGGAINRMIVTLNTATPALGVFPNASDSAGVSTSGPDSVVKESPMVRFSLPSSTTIYLNAMQLGTGTINGTGFIRARRVR